MQRHPSLVPLSHEHFDALAAVRRVLTAADDQPPTSLAVHLLQLPLDGHFLVEEATLAPLLPPDLRDRLLADHRALRADLAHAASPEPHRDRLLAAAQRLHDHVRWEERVAFAWLEANALK